MPPILQILAFFAVSTVEIAKPNASFAKLFDLFAKTFGKLDVPNAFNAIPNDLIAKLNASIVKPNDPIPILIYLFAKTFGKRAVKNASIAKPNAQFAKANAWLPILIYFFAKTFGKLSRCERHVGQSGGSLPIIAASAAVYKA